MSAFNQIMTEKPGLGEPAGKNATESAHIVNAFAVVRAFAGQILIGVGNRMGVGVYADRVREEPAERRAAGAWQGGTDARLDEGVGTRHNPASVIEARLVERVRQRLDHPAGRVVRQLRVTVQGDNKPHGSEMFRIAHVNQTLGFTGPCAHDQVVELFQFPAFAFPPNEFLLGFAPFPLPVQQEKSLAAVALIERFDALFCCLQQDRVRFTM